MKNNENLLVIGDFHIPERELLIPAYQKDRMKHIDLDGVITTGNLNNQEISEWLHSISKKVTHVKGDQDRLNVQDCAVINVRNFKIGIIHGHQITPWGNYHSLRDKAKELDVDILVQGHTHQYSFLKFEDVQLLNPGSATGAFSVNNPNNNPSFVIISFDNDAGTIFHQEFKNEQLNLEKCKFNKIKND